MNLKQVIFGSNNIKKRGYRFYFSKRPNATIQELIEYFAKKSRPEKYISKIYKNCDRLFSKDINLSREVGDLLLKETESIFDSNIELKAIHGFNPNSIFLEDLINLISSPTRIYFLFDKQVKSLILKLDRRNLDSFISFDNPIFPNEKNDDDFYTSIDTELMKTDVPLDILKNKLIEHYDKTRDGELSIKNKELKTEIKNLVEDFYDSYIGTIATEVFNSNQSLKKLSSSFLENPKMIAELKNSFAEFSNSWGFYTAEIDTKNFKNVSDLKPKISFVKLVLSLRKILNYMIEVFSKTEDGIAFVEWFKSYLSVFDKFLVAAKSNKQTLGFNIFKTTNQGTVLETSVIKNEIDRLIALTKYNYIDNLFNIKEVKDLKKIKTLFNSIINIISMFKFENENSFDLQGISVEPPRLLSYAIQSR